MVKFCSAALCAFLLACAPTAYAQTAAPRTIRIGQSLEGELTAREREARRDWVVDYFDIRGTRGETVTISLISQDFDPYLDLDKGEQHVAEDDDGGDILDARLVYRFTDNDTYRISVTSAERTETGRYTLRVDRGSLAETTEEEDDDAPARPQTPRDAPRPLPIRYGQTLQGRLVATSPLHRDDTPYQPYVFSGRRGEVVTIEMIAPEFDAYLVLQKSGASEDLATDDDGADGDGTDARLVHTLAEDGQYEIRANAVAADATGPFALRLAEPRTVEEVLREARAKAPVLTVGQVVRGKLEASDPRAEDDTHYDLYRFVARARQTVVIQLNSDDFDAYLAVHDAADREVASNDDAKDRGTDAEVVFTAPADGEYLIRANTLTEGELGDYMLGLSSR
jgi:hypothetical protein